MSALLTVIPKKNRALFTKVQHQGTQGPSLDDFGSKVDL